MPLRSFLLLSSLLLPVPLLAQPPQHQNGPWAADADGDGRITRAEMRAWMEQRFKLMDSNGDGLVPVEAMQRMLGHEQQAGDRPAAQGNESRKPGRGGFGGHGGRGGHGGSGGPPAGERSSAKRNDGPPPGPPGTVMPYPEDSNDDGMIDLQEFVAPAMAMFDQLDVNGDGVLTADELPPPRRGDGEAPQAH